MNKEAIILFIIAFNFVKYYMWKIYFFKIQFIDEPILDLWIPNTKILWIKRLIHFSLPTISHKNLNNNESLKLNCYIHKLRDMNAMERISRMLTRHWLLNWIGRIKSTDLILSLAGSTSPT